MRLVAPFQESSALRCADFHSVLRFFAAGAAHEMSIERRKAEEIAIYSEKVRPQLGGLVPVSHLDRASTKVSRMSRSHTSWKPGEQRMRDTCDGL